MSPSQVIAIAIFLVVFAVIIWDKVHRYIPALVGAGLVLVMFLVLLREPEAVLRVLNLGQLVRPEFWVPGHEQVESHGVNWQTVVFIGGMMLMVEGLAAAGFFRWLCLYLAKVLNYRVVPIFVAFMLLSGFLSMFIDSITVLLFLASVTIEISRLLKFDPVPVIIAEIFAANTGGAATMAGDPPNIIVGTAFGYTFTDFLTNTGPIAWAGMILALAFFYLSFRKALAAPRPGPEASSAAYPQPREAIADPRMFKASTGVFVVTILLLITHAQTGLSV
ncbi:MAG: anion permease, partial [Chloroflexi bacterium]|nr:anion permease [Chloroflexota bacterium]